MNKLLLISLVASLAFFGCNKQGDSGQEQASATNQKTSSENATQEGPMVVPQEEMQTVEAGCGMCVYKMKGVQGCQTAVMINGKPMLVKGEGKDAHSLGLCKGPKKVMVMGKATDEEFMAKELILKE